LLPLASIAPGAAVVVVVVVVVAPVAAFRSLILLLCSLRPVTLVVFPPLSRMDRLVLLSFGLLD
jgi:hypothetical protein